MISKPTTILGLMSGSSLDGLDLACCTFRYDKRWHYTIEAAETLPYPETWANDMLALMKGTARQLAEAHAAYGHLTGKMAANFIKRHNIQPACIASHGHTLFHDPAQGYTFQLGSGAALAAETGVPVVCDFRSNDVALGGQGAPLVPVGDELLFSKYTACLNIGGIANISLRMAGRRIAWDICPANMMLNMAAGWAGQKLDVDGKMARCGSKIPELEKNLSDIPWFALSPPKSLGREWFDQNIVPLIKPYSHKPHDLLHTLTHWIARTVAAALPDKNSGTVLVTGGGAHNLYLTEQLQKLTKLQIEIPDKQTTDFKEALIFAFLGLLRVSERPNVMPDVTGARRASCGGAIYMP
ncbi:MAG: anhydro-N-acetylmuramic acid kinase [Bacteroidales bacterium]|nr:anhydro-N-acetylmuramic acid kinase [Bacteroidales bacterium]MDD3664986.1 anhydro-N-acetylmuramic acid kinase [Bacteroidales bacterium]